MTTMATRNTPLLAASHELNDMLPRWSKEKRGYEGPNEANRKLIRQLVANCRKFFHPSP